MTAGLASTVTAAPADPTRPYVPLGPTAPGVPRCPCSALPVHTAPGQATLTRTTAPLVLLDSTAEVRKTVAYCSLDDANPQYKMIPDM